MGASLEEPATTDEPTKNTRVDTVGLDLEAVAAVYARCWESAAKSKSPAVRAAAARHFARKAANPPAAAATTTRSRKKERLSNEALEALLASYMKPRPPLRIDHDFIDGLKHWTTPEEREEIRAAATIAVLRTQVNRDREDHLVRMYREKGYVEVEVDQEADSYTMAMREALYGAHCIDLI